MPDERHRKLGALYNWSAALRSGGQCDCFGALIAPNGWNLSSSYDWARLELFLMDNNYYAYFAGDPYRAAIAKALASSSGWEDSIVEATPGYNMTLNNRSLFNAIPASSRHFEGSFGNVGNHASWWRYGGFDSAYPGMGSCIILNHDFAEIMHRMVSIKHGFSIRLVKLRGV